MSVVSTPSFCSTSASLSSVSLRRSWRVCPGALAAENAPTQTTSTAEQGRVQQPHTPEPVRFARTMPYRMAISAPQA